MLSPKKQLKNKSRLGAIVKSHRTEAGLTQRQLADLLNLDYYSMISQIENGYVSIPPTLWRPLAEALEIEVNEWVIWCLIDIQPDVYDAVFGKVYRGNVVDSLRYLERANPLFH